MALEMQSIENNLHDGAGIVVDNGDGGLPPEEHHLLHAQPADRNGEMVGGAEHNRNLEDQNVKKQSSQCSKMWRELNDVVFWRVRLWVVLVGIAVLILSVILISLALCSVIHEDVDEKYDRSSFIIHQYFNGSFQVNSQNFAEKLSSHWSNDSKVLMTELQEKLTDPLQILPGSGPILLHSCSAHFQLPRERFLPWLTTDWCLSYLQRSAIS
ncbi:uncharacterized protein LOC117508653 [Thalassophryne amazonica]|uniref:uncharacterized protein LOC117508653 n=1 Tax=Thalassophryne amazonica TaxID=390379 RepID=UPI001471FAD9|nr:uncharacterized protein LOC117508653 [Thalassophryne amazonica]XP_034024346.1 uncharacterized protein LOC117508653 [Thalassophryne amazonica]